MINKELSKRILSSLILIPIALFFVIDGSFLFTFFIIIFFLVTTYEWYKMSKTKSYYILGLFFLFLSFYSAYQIRTSMFGSYEYFVIILLDNATQNERQKQTPAKTQKTLKPRNWHYCNCNSTVLVAATLVFPKPIACSPAPRSPLGRVVCARRSCSGSSAALFPCRRSGHGMLAGPVLRQRWCCRERHSSRCRA